MRPGSGAAGGGTSGEGGNSGGGGTSGGGGKPESSERHFYNLESPRTIGVGYDTLRHAFPERVRLTALDEIFKSWTTTYNTLYPCQVLSKTFPYPTTLYSGQKEVVFYHHDGFDYRSTIVFGKYQGYPRVQIKLSSNGFIYPPDTSLATDPSFSRTHWHHQRDGWGMVGQETALQAFPAIFAFVRGIMAVSPPNMVSFRALFHERTQRVDLCFVDSPTNPTFGVLVAFEEGYPETLHSLDLWHSG